MKRCLVVCVALSAMVFTSALGASSAIAIGPRDFACAIDAECFATSEQTSEQPITLKFNGGAVKCASAKFSSTSAAGTTVETSVGGAKDWAYHTLTTVPSYSSCTGFGQNVTITTTGCNYESTANTNGATHTSGPYVEGTTTIECTEGKSIVITGNTTKCTVTIGAQTPKNDVIDFYNESSGATADIKRRTTVGTEPVEKGKETGIAYTSSGGACGESGKNGTARGDLTTKCYSSLSHVTQVGCTLVDTVEESGSTKIQALP
jgi:hypothetical protein